MSGVFTTPKMSASNYTYKILSYGNGEGLNLGSDGKPEKLIDDDGDDYAGLGPIIEYYDEEGNNVTPVPLTQ